MWAFSFADLHIFHTLCVFVFNISAKSAGTLEINLGNYEGEIKKK